MKKHLTWVNLTLGLAVVALAAILVWRRPQPVAERTTSPGDAAMATAKPDGRTTSPEPQPRTNLGDIDLQEAAPPRGNAAMATAKPDGGTVSPEPQPKANLSNIDLRETATPQGQGATAQADGYGMSYGSSDLLPPINDVDPLTGKSIGPDSPTLSYYEHVIGFCCVKSRGYTGGWDRMSEAEKDAFVARFVK